MLMKPSFFKICIAQSMEPLYLTPPPEVIIILIVNGVGHEAGSNGDSPSKKEGSNHRGVLSSNEHGLQGIEHTEVHATVDKDTNSRDGEASVQALDAIGLQSLHVHVNQAVELALTTLALGVVGQPGPGKVKGVHEEKGQGSSSTTGGNVGGELGGGRGVLGGGV